VAVVAIGSTGSRTWSPAGDLFAAGSTLSWTAYWLYSKRARSNVSALEYMTSVMLVAAVTLTFVSFGTGTSLGPPQGIDWMWIWIVTLIPGAMGHLFVAWSHRHLEAWMASLITQMMPVVSSIAAWILLGETLTPLAIAGGIVVLAATIAIVLRVSRRTEEEIEPPTAAPVAGSS
jgi:drug/metabolite transporter (DMT)-like permease